MITYATYDEAADTVEDSETHMVCGVRVSDTEDRYFVLDRATPDDEAYSIAFELKHGRPLSTYEKALADHVADRQKADA